MAVNGCDGVWAVGDCALIPMPERRAVSAHRAARDSPGEGARREHRRGSLRRAAALVRVHRPRQARRARPPPRGRRAARRGHGGRGLPAWLMWRGIYWSKLPGASRKTRVADLVAERPRAPGPPRPAQPRRRPRRTQAHYEPGEVVFDEGDAGDSLYMILSGRVEVLQALRRRAAGDRHARAGRVLRRDGPARASSAQRLARGR